MGITLAAHRLFGGLFFLFVLDLSSCLLRIWGWCVWVVFWGLGWIDCGLCEIRRVANSWFSADFNKRSIVKDLPVFVFKSHFTPVCIIVCGDLMT